jgi:CDP-glycerol glycerophosphotransferase
VVLPTHDVEPWLDDCLHSIRMQEGVPFAVIIVDDHSDDETLTIARRHADDDPRITIVSATSHGGGNARNLGASLVTTEYLAFADGDDLVPPGAYRKLVATLDRTGSDMSIGNFYKFAALRAWRPSLRWGAFTRVHTGIRLVDNPALIWNRACWNRVFRTAFWRQARIEFPNVVRSNDIVPMTTALVSATAIDVIPDCVYLYRERPGASSMTAAAGKLEGLLSYLEQETRCAELLAAQPAVVREQYERLVFDADGWVHLRRALIQAYHDGTGVPSLVEDFVRRLTAVADPSSVDRIPLARLIVLRLLLVGQPEAAAELLAIDESGAPRVGESLRDATRRRKDLVDAAFGESALHPLAALELVVEPLVLAAAGATDDELREVIAEIPLDEEAVGASLAHLQPLERRLALQRVARAYCSGDLRKLKLASRYANSEPASLQTARGSWAGIVLKGYARINSTEDTLLVIARSPLTGAEHSVGRLVVVDREGDAVTWSLRFIGRRLREGEWHLLVRIAQDDLGPISVNMVAAGRGPIVPESRWARVVVVPRKQPGVQVVVVVRRGLIQRGFNVLRRLVVRDRRARSLEPS